MKEKTISIENSHQNVHNEWPIESTRSIVMHNLGLELDFEGFVTQESIPSTNELLGVYGTVAIHYIDLCLWLLGEYESIKINCY